MILKWIHVNVSEINQQKEKDFRILQRVDSISNW